VIRGIDAVADMSALIISWPDRLSRELIPGEKFMTTGSSLVELIPTKKFSRTGFLRRGGNSAGLIRRQLSRDSFGEIEAFHFAGVALLPLITHPSSEVTALLSSYFRGLIRKKKSCGCKGAIYYFSPFIPPG
jgi:hypothetical protein